MNKQIEEMAKIVGDCMSVPDEACDKHPTCAYCKATRCYDAGYRKSTDVAREIFEEIDQKCNINGHFEYWRFLELKKKYESEGAE